MKNSELKIVERMNKNKPKVLFQTCELNSIQQCLCNIMFNVYKCNVNFTSENEIVKLDYKQVMKKT